MSQPTWATPVDSYTPQLPTNSRSRAVFAVAITCATLAIIGISLRICARKVKRSRLAAHDYVAVLAATTVCGQAIVTLLQVLVGGAGHHLANVYHGRVINALKLTIPSQLLFAISLGLAKLSICLLYIDLFEKKRFK